MKKSIDKGLDKYLPAESAEPKVIHKAMRYSVFSGGKRIRPVLALEAAKVCGGSIKKVLPAACAIELVHTFSLIHDDLPAMDDDDYRRGKPTCHKAFGESTAILAGDALLALALNVISKNMEPKIGLTAIRELSDALGTGGVIGGQVMDLEFQKKDLSENVLDQINRLKTSKLFEVSTKLGALVAGASQAKVRASADYGADIGMAFQIIDDILDQEGYVEAFGIMRARRDSEILIKSAKDAIKIFGRRADRLKEIADYIRDRAK